MDIIEQIQATIDKKVGYRCDMCYEENKSPHPFGKGHLHQTLEDGCDDTYTKQVDLCRQCTDLVFKFIEGQGGTVQNDF